jgi:hypothetical protein
VIPIVYLGPSLPRCEAAQHLNARYCPPIKRGNLTQTKEYNPIVIIDGEFYQSLSVSPKEILELADRGKTVIGAASMGALRAAELYPFGVQGVGWVYDGYRSGRLRSDDEVAMTYSPLNQQALTVPLVNIRYWVEQLLANDIVDPVLGNKMVRSARKIFFADRTPQRLCQALTNELSSARLRTIMEWSNNQIPDVKAMDTRLTLRLVHEMENESRK